jgi:hypothetical protein
MSMLKGRQLKSQVISTSMLHKHTRTILIDINSLLTTREKKKGTEFEFNSWFFIWQELLFTIAIQILFNERFIRTFTEKHTGD